MQYSDQNREGLMGLLQGLKAGMNPETAYGLYQDINENQMARIAQRQQRLAGLSDLLMNQALSGQTYEGAQALAEAAPGPAGPAVQQMLESLYPHSGEASPTPTGPSGAPLDFPQGSRPTESGLTAPSPTTGMQYQVPQSGPQALSPAFQPQPLSPTEQQAVMEQEQAAAQQQAMAEIVADAQDYARGGKTLPEFLTDVAAAYPDVLATPGGIEQVQQIALTIFNAPQVGV